MPSLHEEIQDLPAALNIRSLPGTKEYRNPSTALNHYKAGATRIAGALVQGIPCRINARQAARLIMRNRVQRPHEAALLSHLVCATLTTLGAGKAAQDLAEAMAEIAIEYTP